MILCPRCGITNRVGAVFCAGCGLPLQSCAYCNAAVRANARFCQQCGQTIATAGIVCGNCQTVNRAQAQFCFQCRHSLVANIPLVANVPLIACSICAQANQAQAKFCRYCGSAIVAEITVPCLQCGYGMRPSARFCLQCGQATKKPGQKRFETGKLPTHSTITGSDNESYLIVSLIAQGGMGAVYQAIRPSDKTIWALKEMSESVVAKDNWEQTLEAFYEEAHLLQALAHENLPKVIDAFEDKQRHYIVMDYIDGHTLTQLMAKSGGPVSEDEVVAWGKQLCLVLNYLHTHDPPIIYRDLKPDNVMVETETDCVKLIDFGIARRFKVGKKSDTVHLGTNGYAAPEQYGKDERQSDAPTDLYALGATLHHLLTGLDPSLSPFNFPDIKIQAKVSTRVNDAVCRAVKLLPHHRHQSAAEMYEALSGEPFPESIKTQSKPKPKPKSTGLSKPPAKSTGTAVSASVLTISSLQADAVVKGTEEVLSLPVKVGSGTLAVSTDVAWLTLSKEMVDRSTKEIEVIADTTQLPLGVGKWDVTYQPDGLFGRIWWLFLWLICAHAYYFVPHAKMHRASVSVGQEKADIQIEVIPSKARTVSGWTISSLVVFAELAGLALVIGFFLMGM